MPDWVADLDPEERENWDTWVRHIREETIVAMDDSAFVMSLVPEETDVKFAVELGMAIMLDKPIIAVVHPGAKVPVGLRKVADAVIEADIDTEAGRDRIATAMKDFAEKLEGDG